MLAYIAVTRYMQPFCPSDVGLTVMTAVRPIASLFCHTFIGFFGGLPLRVGLLLEHVEVAV